jgi:hypothetical protein
MNVQGAFHNGVKQQHREQKVIHQRLGLLPNRTVQTGVPAQKVTAQDEGEIGE